MNSKSGAQANQSIIDSIAVLQALATAGKPIGGSEISKILGLEATRANRILKTLASIGITQQTSNRKYEPGPGMHVLATQSLYASGLLRNSLAPLEKLAFYGRTVALGVLWYDSVSFLYHARPGMNSSEGIGRIGLRDATTSGIGLVLLAITSEASVRSAYEGREIPNFPQGVESLLTKLAEIRKLGYARVEVESDNPQAADKTTHTIAIPLGNPVNSAIALSGWISESETPEVVKALQKAHDEIEFNCNNSKVT
ncbi:helix-turn-helix domain-containing protein [Colwellia echini]|uniref:Helix-turn-helix domain-containing protein n=1 Tax=Colwellia echini TaxID=1982103 RepID=A0ABY3MYL3_9GAMM|nr:helix-turn-helix domain-containing protein [Colwellia echini]